jgi:histidyl-tRNA synthetase
LESALKYDPTVPLARMMWANFMEAKELKKAECERDKAVLARAAH